jgi:hypothetical protein
MNKLAFLTEVEAEKLSGGADIVTGSIFTKLLGISQTQNQIAAAGFGSFAGNLGIQLAGIVS